MKTGDRHFDEFMTLIVDKITFLANNKLDSERYHHPTTGIIARPGGILQQSEPPLCRQK